MSAVKISQVFVPDVTTEVGPKTQLAIRQVFTALQTHEAAFASLKTQVDAKATAKTTPTNTAITAATSSTLTAAQVLATLGHVDSQTGTTYVVQDTDYGGLITFGNTQPVAVTLNSACRQFWFAVMQNLGPGLVTVTPDQRTINQGPDITLATNASAWIFFDGMVWWAATMPTAAQSIAAVANEFLTSYDASTGTFTLAQPTFANIAGTVEASQLPPGLSRSYDYTASTPSTTWVVQHNLGTYPNIVVVDGNGNSLEPDLEYNSLNQVTLTFSAPSTGVAHLV